jgi:hypothetical protein
MADNKYTIEIETPATLSADDLKAIENEVDEQVSNVESSQHPSGISEEESEDYYAGHNVTATEG